MHDLFRGKSRKQRYQSKIIIKGQVKCKQSIKKYTIKVIKSNDNQLKHLVIIRFKEEKVKQTRDLIESASTLSIN